MTNESAKRLAAAICFVLGLASTELAHAGEIAWRRIPQAAQQEAQQSARPLLIYVGADFCGYCRRLERTTWGDDSVARTIDSSFVPLHVDGAHDGELARRLGVRGFPAVIVLSPAGQIVGRVDGYRGPAEMQAFLMAHAGVSRDDSTGGTGRLEHLPANHAAGQLRRRHLPPSAGQHAAIRDGAVAARCAAVVRDSPGQLSAMPGKDAGDAAC